MAKPVVEDPKKLVLEVKSRQIFGKKLRKLRKEGVIPGNIFGTDFDSQSIMIDYKDFIKAYRTVHETGVIYLKLNNTEIPAMIRNLQKHPVNNSILHVDFRKIDLKTKIEIEVPIKIVGESTAVTQKGGVLLTLAESLMVEALPQEVPQHIEIDISLLTEIGQEIKVADLKKMDNYVIKEEPNKVIVSVVEHKEESVTPETAAPAAPEVITEAEKEAKEGVATEGGAKPEDEKKQQSEPKTEEKK